MKLVLSEPFWTIRPLLELENQWPYLIVKPELLKNTSNFSAEEELKPREDKLAEWTIYSIYPTKPGFQLTNDPVYSPLDD